MRSAKKVINDQNGQDGSEHRSENGCYDNEDAAGDEGSENMFATVKNMIMLMLMLEVLLMVMLMLMLMVMLVVMVMVYSVGLPLVDDPATTDV